MIASTMRQPKEGLPTYQKCYVDRDYEQLDLFQLLKSEFGISNGIYSGITLKRLKLQTHTLFVP